MSGVEIRAGDPGATCGSCRWWDGNTKAEPRRGLCHSASPSFIAVPRVKGDGSFGPPWRFSGFPETGGDDWCGDWEPRA